jgi:hypothetical protein
MGTHCAHPSSQSVLSPAACTRIGSRGRNTCTACTNAVRIRTSDTSRPPSSPAVPCRTARIATLPAFPADSPVSVPARGPTSEDHWCAPAVLSASPVLEDLHLAIPGRDPDIHADDISPQTLPKHVAVFCARRRPRGKSFHSTDGTQYLVPSIQSNPRGNADYLGAGYWVLGTGYWGVSRLRTPG